MKFQILDYQQEDRISHPQAIYTPYVYVDIRSTDSPKKVPAYKGEEDWWFSEGKNHRLENGQIARDLDTSHCWVLEISDLDTFISVISDLGDVCIERPSNKGIPADHCLRVRNSW